MICNFLDKNLDHRVNVQWCPSHSNIQGNEEVDRLAKAATTLARTSPVGTTRAYALRRARATTQEAWRREWRNSPHLGLYAVANRLPPSLKPSKHFRELKAERELFGRVLQCRTGHGHTGEFKQKFKLSEDVDCPCGSAEQTREHILRVCTRYEAHRTVLREVSRDIVLSEILGTKKGIEALTVFLRRTGAFSQAGFIREPCPAPEFDDESDVPEDEWSGEEDEEG